MNLSEVSQGRRVVIVATDEFYAYVHGWTGHISGINSGSVVVEAKNPDNQTITLFVPPAQLAYL